MSDSHQRFVRTVCSARYELSTIPWPEIVTCLQQFIAAAQQLDSIKRTLFYGIPLATPLPCNGDIPDPLPNFEHVHQDAFHGIIGVCTEAGELAERLLRMAANPDEPTHRLNLIEELGDIGWYTALLMSVLGVDSTYIENANQQKLSHRYDKVTGVTSSATRLLGVRAKTYAMQSETKPT